MGTKIVDLPDNVIQTICQLLLSSKYAWEIAEKNLGLRSVLFFRLTCLHFYKLINRLTLKISFELRTINCFDGNRMSNPKLTQKIFRHLLNETNWKIGILSINNRITFKNTNYTGKVAKILSDNESLFKTHLQLVRIIFNSTIETGIFKLFEVLKCRFRYGAIEISIFQLCHSSVKCRNFSYI